MRGGSFPTILVNGSMAFTVTRIMPFLLAPFMSHTCAVQMAASPESIAGLLIVARVQGRRAWVLGWGAAYQKGQMDHQFREQLFSRWQQFVRSLVQQVLTLLTPADPSIFPSAGPCLDPDCRFVQTLCRCPPPLLLSENWRSGGPAAALSCLDVGGIILVSNRMVLPADGISFNSPSEGMLGVVSLFVTDKSCQSL